MKDFFKRLFGSATGVSSKRVYSLFVLVNLVVMTWYCTIKAGVTPQYQYQALGWIVAAGLGLTSAEKIFKKKDE